MPNQNAASERPYHLLTADRPLSAEKILPREHVLAAVTEGFVQRRFVLLQGKSGIGKTKTAELIFRRSRLEYAFAAWYRFTGDFQKDFYLQISDHALLERLETQIAFGKENGLGSDLIDQRCALACRQYWEEFCPGPKLIIVDGVQDFQALTPHLHLLDIPDVRVLITTQTLPDSGDFRLRDVFSFAVVEVPPLDSSELETMLGYFGQTIEDAQLADYLGQSPLLLRLFLKNNTPEQPEKSRALVARLLREGPGEDLDGRLIYALLEFADLPPAILWTLMQLAAMPDKFHDPDFIAAIIGLSGVEKPVYTQGYNIFKGKGRNRHSTDDVVKLDEILDWLVDRGWLECDEQEAFHCHPTFVVPLRRYCKPEYDFFLEQGKQLDLIFFLNENGYDEERLDPADLRLHRISDSDLEGHLATFIAFVQDSRSEYFRTLLTRYADLLNFRIKWQQELKIRWQIVEQWDDQNDEKDDAKLFAIDKLAHCLLLNGYYKTALDYYLYIHGHFEKMFPSTHPNLVGSLSNLGAVYLYLGKYATSLEYDMRVLEILESTQSSDDPQLAFAYHSTGVTLERLGHHADSLKYKIKAMEIWEQTLPPDHPDLARNYNTLGVTYGDLEDYPKALEYAIKALEIREAILPPNHPDLARSYNNVGVAYEDLGDFELGLEYEMKALKQWESVLPDDHPDLATSYSNVGVAFKRSGKYSEALEYLLRALKIWESTAMLDHPSVLGLYETIGDVYMSLDDLPKFEYYRQLANL